MNNRIANYAEVSIDYAVQRYVKEYDRLLGVMDRRLADREYLGGEYSIADIAAWPWVRSHERLGQALDSFEHLQRWFNAIAVRPAVKKGSELGLDWWNREKFDAETRKNLFGQTSSTVGDLARQASARNE